MSFSQVKSLDVPGNAGTSSNLHVYGKVEGQLPLSDRDWYRVYLEAGRTYTVVMSDRDDPNLAGDFPYDSWVRLYDAAGKLIQSGSEDGVANPDDSQLVYTPLYSGTYYVEARGSVYAAGTGSYTVELLAQGSSTDLPQSTTTTQRLLLRTPFSSSIDAPTDVDWMQLDLAAGVNYAVNVAATTLRALSLALYDGNGQYLRTLGPSDVFSSSSGGTHFVAVSSNENSETGTYSLEWISPTALLSIEGGYSATQSVANERDGSMTFTVRLSKPVGSGVSVLVTSRGSVTATADADFTSVNRLVAFAPGETVKTFSVPIANDTLSEPAEAFELCLSDPTGGVGLSSRVATGYVFDDDFKSPTVNGVSLFDPYTIYQWYLYAGTGANVVEAWKSYTGKGVQVAVFDQGIDPTQSDLDGNLRLDLSRVAGSLAAGGEPIYAGDNHGTAVAGVIAAEHNGVDVVGVAFEAQLVSLYTSFGNGPEDYEAVNRNAFTYAANFDVLNDSWGYAPREAYRAIDYDWAFFDNFLTASFDAQGKALKALAESGRKGLGTIVVQSAGNSYSIGDDTNLHNYQNSRYIITVAATDYLGDVTEYSSPGSSVLVAAPGGGSHGGLSDIFTTDRTGALGYAAGNWTTIAGTSFSAPLVSGIVALMLEANPSLGFRDVQQILAYSARATSGQYNTWSYNGARDWNGGGLHFDAITHDLGFGLVDALAATRLAETWGKISATAANDVELTTVRNAPAAVPDNDIKGLTQTITETRSITVERVEVTVDMIHTYIGDLGLLLTSPSGTSSWLIYRPGTNELAPFGQDQDNINFVFDTVLSMGEASVGDWKLSVYDLAAGDFGELRAWTLNLIGKPQSNDNAYVYTNEYGESVVAQSSRAVLSDTSGFDTINASAVTTPSTIDLTPGGSSLVDGAALSLAANAIVEAAYGGDGDDSITGNDTANTLWGGRGSDTIRGGAGDDTIRGGAGNDSIDGGLGADTAEYGGSSGSYVVAAMSTGFQVVGATEGTDILNNVEFVKFADLTITLGLVLTGTMGNDFFASTVAADSISGLEGLDTVQYYGPRSNFKVTSAAAGGWSIQDLSPSNAMDQITGVERLNFTDIGLALDVGATQSAGKTQLLLGAVLGKELLAVKKLLIGDVIELFDQGYTLQQLAGAGMRLPIWDVLTGKATPTNTDIATYLLTRVNGSAPDSAVLSAAVQALDSETGAAQGNFLWHLAESAANQLQVGLVGLSITGLEFEY